MYSTYELQKQICAAPNGPVNKDHGSVLIDIFFIMLFDAHII
jgi:hypothetical protein